MRLSGRMSNVSWVLAATLHMFVGWHARGATGPSSQQEAEAWLEQIFGWVEEAAGLKAGKAGRPRIKRVEAAEAGQALAREFTAQAEFSRELPMPPPEALGQQYLARYAFGNRTIYVLPSNLERVSVVERLSSTERMQLMKIVLAGACDLALLDSHVGFAEAYYTPGGQDARLAQRSVWEGHARLAQYAVAEQVGASQQTTVSALLNTFMIAPELDPKASDRERMTQVSRVTSMGRLSDVGSRFIEALRRARGPRGVLEALQRPPHRTSQILVPGDYLSGAGFQPTDQALGEALARIAGAYFQPQWWTNESMPLGALSLDDILATEAWNAGAGPQKRFAQTFDLDYVAGRSLVGRRKDDRSVRAAGLHLFRSARAIERFIQWRAAGILEDWERLETGRFVLKEKKDLQPKEADLPEGAAARLDGGRMLHVVAVRPDQSQFREAHYYLYVAPMLLELDLDLLAPKELLGESILELETFSKRVSETLKHTPETPGKPVHAP